MLTWNAVTLLVLLGAEPSIITPPLVADETPAKNVIWIQPLASTPGRASVSYERALGKGASVHLGLVGGLALGDVTDPETRLRTVFNEGVGLVGFGVRAFPLGAAPFGPWIGGQVSGGFAAGDFTVESPDEALLSMKYSTFIGEGELQAGCSLSLYKGLAVQGSVGVRGTYQRYTRGVLGDTLQFGLATWLGLGYAF